VSPFAFENAPEVDTAAFLFARSCQWQWPATVLTEVDAIANSLTSSTHSLAFCDRPPPAHVFNLKPDCPYRSTLRTIPPECSHCSVPIMPCWMSAATWRWAPLRGVLVQPKLCMRPHKVQSTHPHRQDILETRCLRLFLRPRVCAI